jgi:hypothetical protein
MTDEKNDGCDAILIRATSIRSTAEQRRAGELIDKVST